MSRPCLPVVVLAAALLAAVTAGAQTVTPTSISIAPPSPVCAFGSATEPVCLTLPPASVADEVDVFFLFDDTGSFAGFVPTVSTIFGGLVGALEAAVPGVSFGFGVGRLEDYGGPGTGFSGEFASGRPFLLNQPIVTAADAGGAGPRDALIAAALDRTAPGFGGDTPETSIEGLYQVATGTGFDGDGDGLTTGVGGAQPAGALATQTSPDGSGDVPAFSSLVPAVVHSGAVGGAGFRAGALRLVILATDTCPVAPFPPGPIPPAITGTGGTEPVTRFACSFSPGSSRFGFVSDAKSLAANTVPNAVAPSGAGAVAATVAALNAAGIRVLGMAPGGAPSTSTGPDPGPSTFLSAFARITGAVDAGGTPLVFDIGAGGLPLQTAIVNAIRTSATTPIDVALVTGGTVPPGLGVGIAPPLRPNVPPGGQACFDVAFHGFGFPMGTFRLDFHDAQSGGVLGTVPVDVSCPFTGSSLPPTTTTTTSSTTTTTLRCGNGVVEPGETCDPPDLTPIPGVVPPQPRCRLDCTSCGDGVVQAGDGETCDDGNLVSGCDPKHPTIPLDNCQVNCTAPFCDDPGLIKNAKPRHKLSLHGRAVPIDGSTPLDPVGRSFAVQLKDTFGGLIFRKSVPAGVMQNYGPGLYRYRNPARVVTDGVKELKITIVRGTLLSYRVSVVAYGDLAQAVEKMSTSVFVGPQEWSINGIWVRKPWGWTLSRAATY